MASNCGQTVQFTKVNGGTTWLTGMADSFMRTVTHTWDSGSMTMRRVKEFIIMQMELSIKDNGWTISNMALEKKFGQMEQPMKETLLMGKNKDKAVFFGLITPPSKEIF